MNLRTLIDRLLLNLFKVLPVDRKLIVLESFPDFGDNAWPLYKYLQAKGGYRFVWFVEHPENFKKEDDTIFLNRFRFNIKTLYYLSRCHIYFYTHRLYSSFVPKKNQKVVALWHGAPIKAGKGSTSYYMDYCITTGNDTVHTTAVFLGKPDNIMLPLGYPRNDLLFKSIGLGKDNPFCPIPDAKVIIWMPTFRSSTTRALSETQCDSETGLPLLTTDDSVASFNDYLRERKVVVLIKIHPLQMGKEVFKKKFSNLVFVTNDDLEKRGLQLYDMVGKSDALLSDYSSIIFDYLITGKPQGFILDDLQQYSEGRGVVYDNIEEVLQGSLIYKIPDLYEFIEDVINEKDNYKEKRLEWARKCLASLEDKACENICNYFNI